MTNILQGRCLNEKALKSLCAPLTLVLPHLWQTPNMTALMKEGKEKAARYPKSTNFRSKEIKSKAYSSALSLQAKRLLVFTLI